MYLLQASIGPAQVSGLIIKTYIMGAIFGLIMLGIAILVSNAIAYGTGRNTKDTKQREIVFWFITALTPVLFYLYNFLIVMTTIKKGPAQTLFQAPAAISAIVSFVTILVLGIILSKTFKDRKIGNWFPTKK
jgi:uncharacterized membrane protein